MIQESYVTLNQAWELKELGFPQLQYTRHFADFDYPKVCTMLYYNSSGGIELFTIDDNEIDELLVYACPTLSLAQKWLREEKDLIIDVGVMSKKVALVSLSQFTKHGITPILHMKSSDDYSSYEEALSAGIDECIKLLKEK